MSIIEKYLNEYLANMMSTLLILPDNPEQGVLYLLTGVLNLIEKHLNWENVDVRFNLLVNVIIILTALKQEDYLYHIDYGMANSCI
jgi:hypothetical protein